MGVRKLFNAASSRKSLQSNQLQAEQRMAAGQASRSSAEIAGYIAQMTAEMGQMAGAARLDVLAYLLSMARAEARRSARRAPFDGAERVRD